MARERIDRPESYVTRSGVTFKSYDEIEVRHNGKWQRGFWLGYADGWHVIALRNAEYLAPTSEIRAIKKK